MDRGSERFLNINQWTGSASQADASLLSAQLGLDPLWIDELIDFTDIDQTPNRWALRTIITSGWNSLQDK